MGQGLADRTYFESILAIYWSMQHVALMTMMMRLFQLMQLLVVAQVLLLLLVV
jgi:hypothetical protein